VTANVVRGQPGFIRRAALLPVGDAVANGIDDDVRGYIVAAVSAQQKSTM
jgi:hypothetical protein